MAKFKQACFAHGLSKKFPIFTAVHKSNVLNSAAKLIHPNLSAYNELYGLSKFSLPLTKLAMSIKFDMSEITLHTRNVTEPKF